MARKRIKRENRFAKLCRLISEKKKELNKKERTDFEFNFRMKHSELFINQNQ